MKLDEIRRYSEDENNIGHVRLLSSRMKKTKATLEVYTKPKSK